ncbi:MAG: hypothetical protein ACLSGS_08640 [Adlercreutzia sp.]
MGEDIIKHNPMLKEPILTVLALAEEAGDRATLEATALRYGPSFSQAPAAVIDTLVRHGFLSQQSYVNGEPYEGTLEDMQLDESVPDDAVAEVRLAVTEVGRALAAAYDPASTLASLFGERPRYADVFSAILDAASADEGASAGHRGHRGSGRAHRGRRQGVPAVLPRRAGMRRRHRVGRRLAHHRRGPSDNCVPIVIPNSRQGFTSPLSALGGSSSPFAGGAS